jgi:hypothetical protein
MWLGFLLTLDVTIAGRTNELCTFGSDTVPGPMLIVYNKLGQKDDGYTHHSNICTITCLDPDVMKVTEETSFDLVTGGGDGTATYLREAKNKDIKDRESCIMAESQETACGQNKGGALLYK